MNAGPLGPRPALRHLIRTGGLLVLVALLGLVGLAQAQAPPETIEYYATDALGSVRVVFTPMGQVLGRSDYLPFGETLTQTGALPRQRFTGQKRDGEAGLDYFNARSLQTRTGRMNRPDPLFGNAITNPQQWNRYAYVDNNPLKMTDPTGLQDWQPSDGISETVTVTAALPIQQSHMSQPAWWADANNGDLAEPGRNKNGTVGDSGGGSAADEPPLPSKPTIQTPPTPAPTVPAMKAADPILRFGGTAPKAAKYRPDYGTISLGIGGPTFGVIVACTKDSFGHYYCGLGPSAGKTYSMFSLDYQQGSMVMPQNPSEKQLQSFLTEWSVNGGACLVYCGSVSGNFSGVALQQGWGFPQLGGSGVWMWQIR